VPLLSAEIVGECRSVRRADQPGSADAGVTVVDAWQGRGLGSALLTRLSERALELGIEYFTAEILAESRTMLALLPSLSRVETESLGPVVTARVELTRRAIWASWEVSVLAVSTLRLRGCPPVAFSSIQARSAKAPAPMPVSMSWAVRSWSRASRRRWRRSHSP
jgi:Acetyltransferase (GNAT) family